VLALSDDNQAFHITDKNAVGTDWNLANASDPTVYIHSNTSPITDYLRIGDHDGTTAYIDVVGGTTLALEIGGTTEAQLSANNFFPGANDGNALGLSGTAWSDLFLASGAVVNFNAGNMSITHSAAQLTIGGGTLSMSDNNITNVGDIQLDSITGDGSVITLKSNTFLNNGYGVVIGHTAKVPGWATTEFQVLGQAATDGGATLGVWSTSQNPVVQFIRSRNTTIGSIPGTIVTDNDILGQLLWIADDGADYQTIVGDFRCDVDDGSPAENQVGAAFLWRVATSGGSLNEVWRMTSSGQLISGGINANPSAVTYDGSIIAEGGLAFSDTINAMIDDETRGGGTVTHYIGNQAITTSSDSRIKDVLGDTTNALDKLAQLHVVDHTWKPNYGAHEAYNRRGVFTSLIAQEAIEVVPYAVNANSGEDCLDCLEGRDCDSHFEWHMQYEYLVPLLIKGMQEMQVSNEALEERVRMLSNGHH
jgi:hypothetical protein